jgi:hypothetical protein
VGENTVAVSASLARNFFEDTFGDVELFALLMMIFTFERSERTFILKPVDTYRVFLIL